MENKQTKDSNRASNKDSVELVNNMPEKANNYSIKKSSQVALSLRSRNKVLKWCRRLLETNLTFPIYDRECA